ncbi:hypothetical protein QBC44DRAFT_401639 [Cladorrhinum sp. PSN332]|nr:hypothetical protein QBC44DRAFT_401639 [Cladorrhinum sp. PSN332]
MPFRSQILPSNTFYSTTSDQFPASYRRDNELEAPDGIPDLYWIEEELNPKRLHQIMNYLWLAGRPVPPRPLHYQILLGREIVISESIDHHLVWGNGNIYIKPLPRYLLNPRFWSEVLTEKELDDDPKTCTCHALSARQNALGLLLQYAALISHESDFLLAIDKKLLPPIDWPKWRRLVRELISNSDSSDTSLLYAQVSPRFIYGELRLNRLNFISLLKGPPASFLRGGYMSRWSSYGSLYRDNSNMILAATAYILLALSAMQVGLGTTKLMDDEVFQRVSYGFTVFSIVGPLGMLVVSVGFFVVIIGVNLVRTRRFEGERSRRLGRRWRGDGGDKYAAEGRRRRDAVV